MKIGFLIPSTSKGRPWLTFKDMYLYAHTLRSFLTTYDMEHSYTFYIGVDHDDPLFTQQSIIKQFKRFIGIMKNVTITFLPFNDIPKGHLTKMWNRLFKKAYEDSCDYFFQCGDDITFQTKGWVNACIEVLEKNNNIGVTSPICRNNQLILTQSFVSRKHMDIFGIYFPEEIINWGCDDWINIVYKPKHFFPLMSYFCNNVGGRERYVVDNDHSFYDNYRENLFALRKRVHTLTHQTYIPILEKYIRQMHIHLY